MNIFKKAWCRTFQLSLRAALPVLPYRQPEILESIKDLPIALRKEHADTVLLVTDKGIRGCGLTKGLEDTLRDAGIRCVVYDRTVANPTSENVESARELYIRENCRALIGFGGGSSIDCAKGVGARIAKPHQPLEKMAGLLKVHRKLPPLIAVPTTAGTGSEVTLAAVITDSLTHHKYAIEDFFLIPKYAVLDPELTRSLSKSLTATTALDALTHAVEAYIGRSTTKETRKCSLEATALIFQNLEKAYKNGSDMTARRNLLRAAYLAGNAFSKSYVGYVHAVAHSLSGKYGLAHGYTNAVLLPWVLEEYGPVINRQLSELAVAAGIASSDTDRENASLSFIQSLREMNRRFNIPRYFSEIRKEDIPGLALTADKEANPLYPVPVLWDHRKLEVIYNEVMEGKSTCRENSLNAG